MSDTTHLEDVGAIAVEMANSKRYEKLYEALGEYIGGFSALWGFVATVGDVFHEEAKRLVYDNDDKPWKDGEGWVESVTATADRVMDAAIKDPASVPANNFTKEQRDWIRPHIRMVL